MNSLPLISHRLFVAAIRHEAPASVKPGPSETSFMATAGKAAALPLEVLQLEKSAAVKMARPLRGSGKTRN